MAASNILNLQQSSTLGHAVADGLCALGPGAARSLVPSAPMALCIVAGQAWVTLGDGPHGLGGAAGDVFLHAGQTLWVAAGQHAVVEALCSAPLQYRWGGLEDVNTAAPQPWWSRAVKVRAHAPRAAPCPG